MTASEDLGALRDALELLAAEPDVQRDALSVLRRAAAELRAGIDDLRPVDQALDRAGLLAPGVRDDIERIDHALGSMLDRSALWTAEALRSARAWQHVRRLARTALRTLDAAPAAGGS